MFYYSSSAFLKVITLHIPPVPYMNLSKRCLIMGSAGFISSPVANLHDRKPGALSTLTHRPLRVEMYSNSRV